MDRLDPYKRKSNVNKDLRALGIATAVSGMLGGLGSDGHCPQLGECEQRRKDAFDELFTIALILVFVLFLREVLTQIPLPALAAILVFTGYKL